MKCYYFGNDNHKPTLSEGITGKCFTQMLKARNIAATPGVAEAFEKEPYRRWKTIDVRRSEDYPDCFKLYHDDWGIIDNKEYLVVTAPTVRATDGEFLGVPGVEVIWQDTDDGDAVTAMLVTGMTAEEFTKCFCNKIEFMYP